MVSLKSILTLSALAALPVLASGKQCIDQKEAEDLVWIFQTLFVNIDPKLANHTLTEDFQLFSNTQNSIIPNRTFGLDDPTYATRAAFIADQPTGNPNATNFFTTLDVFHSCKKIAFRWEARNGLAGFGNPLRGIDTLDLEYEHGHWKVSADYSEWNNVAFLQGIGACQIC